MNLAAFIDASISKQPARTFGWLATKPIGLPSSLANPIMIFSAYKLNNSMKWPSSTISSITLTISYGLLGLSGTRVASSGFNLVGSSAVGSIGGLAMLWSGRKPMMSIARAHASSSSSAIRHAIPERLAWSVAPPKPAASISPLMHSGVSSGEDMNNWPWSFPSIVKSARLAPSADTPTTGPNTSEIIGTRPEHCTRRSSNSPVPPSAAIPSCARWPPPSQIPTIGTFVLSAISTTLAILRACISPIEPPWTEKSCAKQ